MPRLDRDKQRFSVNTFVAAMLALYLAMSIGLERPYWAIMTVYIVSGPLAAAVRSKALYRFLGTFVGAAGAVLLVPLLVHAPLLLSLAMSLWVGGCLALSVLDRSPPSYILMLAGYTCAMIGFPAVNQPTAIFDIAAARVEEILIGIACAALVHSLVFPRPVGTALRGRIGHWLGEADRWALDLLRGELAQLDRDRGRLAGAASEIQLMARHLPFDTSFLRETTAVVRQLRDRVLVLIPVLASLSDRLAALRAITPELDPELRGLLAALAAWIESGAPRARGAALITELETARTSMSVRDWYGFNRSSLLTRAIELVRAQADAHALHAYLQDPEGPPPRLFGADRASEHRPLHRDLGLAALSGAAAFGAVLLCCVVWIWSGWQEGESAAITAAITCCLFAAMDDPVPAIRKFGLYLVAAMVLGALYLFVLMPAISGFPMLVLVLAPTLLVVGAMIPDPRLAFPALSVIVNLVNTLVIQDHFSADFARFVNINLSQFFGVFAAVLVTRTLRSMSAEVSARRLLRHTWGDLARVAAGREEDSTVDLASRLVDRVGLLSPKLAAARAGDLKGLDILRELRVGIDLASLRALCSRLPPPVTAELEVLLDGVGARYQARALGVPVPPEQPLRAHLDRLLGRLARGDLAATGARGLCALVGLRRNLFPEAAPPAPVVEGAA
ncbi:FUSC family protein [Marichromatium bheemlicum]|uniref:FUSC family protein n=1 Tax=Marichromatium bheemlicum TaxID=365339 RepID=A0ABX1IDM4_9GAMM|nr:FUSC family protein [Marichromatium bheemlicum]NKN34275.1 FUSC family protein [Marichromatium bheemlicum]